MKKKHVHKCIMKGPEKARTRSRGKKVSSLHRGTSKKALLEIYDQYYRDQVAALYRAVRNEG